MYNTSHQTFTLFSLQPVAVDRVSGAQPWTASKTVEHHVSQRPSMIGTLLQPPAVLVLPNFPCRDGNAKEGRAYEVCERDESSLHKCRAKQHAKCLYFYSFRLL